MAVDPKANVTFRVTGAVKYDPGQLVWVSGIQLSVVANQGNLLTLRPVTAKIS